MSEKKFINVLVSFVNTDWQSVKIPSDINEVELKALLRDLGYISSYQNAYLTTKVYLYENNEEICIPEYRSISELGIGEGTKLIIQPGREPEPRVEYRNVYRNRPSYGGFGGGALYGCPIAQSVKEAINEAERYSDGDSTISTGFINS